MSFTSDDVLIKEHNVTEIAYEEVGLLHCSWRGAGDLSNSECDQDKFKYDTWFLAYFLTLTASVQ